jgi:hypothetical protein
VTRTRAALIVLAGMAGFYVFIFLFTAVAS